MLDREKGAPSPQGPAVGVGLHGEWGREKQMQWRGERDQGAVGLGSYEDYALSKEVWGCDPSQTTESDAWV